MLRHIIVGSAILAASLGISGCSDDTSMEMPMQPMYEVSITNLTAGQPMSPAIVALHNANYTMYTLGSSATTALEHLAEGGDNSELLAAAISTTDVDDTFSTDGLLTPGATVSLTVEGSADYLSLVTMLVNTNDGFVGVNTYHLSHLAKGETEELSVPTYDAGTEANSETSDTVPAQGGEGFNVVRDDSNRVVRVHSGVVSADDGLSSSALGSINRFDNPTAKVVIKRIQ